MNTASDPRSARFALFGLLAIQLLVGYEWLMSGLTKIARGGFPSGLAGEMRDIDLDSLLPAIQLVLVGVSFATWHASRLTRAGVSVQRGMQPEPPEEVVIGAP